MTTIRPNHRVSRLALIALIGGFAACTSETVFFSPPDNSTSVDKSSAQDGGAARLDGATPIDPDGRTPKEDVPSPPLATDLAITDVAIFQAVKVPIVKSGAGVGKSSRNAPVVAERPALVRVYVEPRAGSSPSEITAELRLTVGTTPLPTLRDTKTILRTSTDEAVDSTFNFEVPASSLPLDVTFQVLLTSTNGTVPSGTSDARFPKDGSFEALETDAAGKLRIVMVPVKYDADGSGRTPDFGAEQLALYKKAFMALYPTTEVELTTRTPWSYASSVAANGPGFSNLLNALIKLRQTDNAADDVYYYGAFAPTASFSSFCRGGCVSGLSTRVERADTPSLRASIGLGYSGNNSVETATHEVGHAHGRAHAPCGGADSTDPNFPYPGGGIGTWGYNILDKTFISPSVGKDIMGYCENDWVSDYTFAALFDRVAIVNRRVSTSLHVNARAETAASTKASRQTFRMATLDGNGTLSWDGELTLDRTPTSNDARKATFLTASGETAFTQTAHFFPYDHLPGGVLMVPTAPAEEAPPAASIRTWSHVRISGAANLLAR